MGIKDQEIILLVISQNNLEKYGFYVDQYLNLVLDTISDNSTLVMNCFTWNSFCQNGYFDIRKTPSEVGLASEIFRRMDGVIRSPHPIYSMCAKGPLAADLMIHDCETSWGKGSPFYLLTKMNAFCLSIGRYLDKAITLWHHFEELKEVPYRHFKEFKGVVNFGDGEKSYSTKFFVRNSQDIKYSWKPALDLLDKRNLIKKPNFDLPVYGVFAKDLKETAFDLLDKDIEVFLKKD